MKNFNFPEKYLTTKKKRTWKFWAGFWLISLLFLMVWFFFWEYKKSGWLGIIHPFISVIQVAPIEEKQKEELKFVFKIASILSKKQEVQTFLILFQNNLELRPGGGFIGAFGILKIENGQVIKVEVHDTNVFDDRTTSGIKPPYPMAETLNISNWEMRDSNWSPDFPTNAKKAIEFYQVQGGKEKFEGVIAVSTELLNSFLEFTGPISIENFPGEYNHKNAIEKLEYQVERGYKEQNIEKGKRKYIMKYLAREILDKIQKLGIYEKKELLLRLEEHLNQKDVVLNFFDSELQREVEKLAWDGKVIRDHDQDYLMFIDANLGAYKTDAKMVRTFDYQVDFSQKNPTAQLDLTYTNTARTKDWMTSDYQSYLRIYTPKESWLLESNNHHPVKFGEVFNKKYFGTLVQIPINQSRTYSFKYRLPEKINLENYNLTIQKQSGISEIKGEIKLINKNNAVQKYKVKTKEDWELK